LDDNAVVQLEFDGGADGLLWASLAAPGHRNGLRFKIVGTKASLEWRQEAPETLLLGRLDEADKIYRRGQSDLTPDARASISLPAGNPEGYLEALANLYADYAKALEAGANWRTSLIVPPTDIHEGVRGVAFCEVCLKSSKRRKWASFPAA
jgi:predicted dehydrogenase